MSDGILEGSVHRALAVLTMPLLFGLAATSLVYAADAYFVSRLGTQALAALGYAFPTTAVITAVLLGLGSGVTSALARRIGHGNQQRSDALAWHSAVLALIAAAVTVVVVVVLATRALTAMGARGVVLELALEYVMTWVWCVPCLALLQVTGSALRAQGDTLTSGKLLLLTAFGNLTLDPLLIFGWGPIPALGLRGAALAMVLSYGISSLLLLKVAFRSRLLGRTYSLVGFERSCRAMLAVGLPSMLSQALTPVGAVLLTSLVSLHGHEAVAACAVGLRLERLVSLVPMALGGSVEPFVGQNWGRGNLARVRKANAVANRAMLTFGFAAWAVFAMCASSMSTSFVHTEEAGAALKAFVYVMPAGYAALCSAVVTGAGLSAIGRGATAAAAAVMRTVALAFPLAWFGSTFGLAGIFGGVTAARIISALIATLALRATFARLAQLS
jgi:putative MATE family efflux protein